MNRPDLGVVPLHQPQALSWRGPGADDDVVVDADAQGLGGVDDLPRHVVSAREGVGRGRWLCTRMMALATAQGPLDDLADVDGRVIHRTLLLHLVRNQPVFLIEKKDAELLACLEPHGGTAVFQHRGPRPQHGALHDAVAHQAQGRRPDQLQVRDDGIPDAP